jgi:signal transduction histidine kinase
MEKQMNINKYEINDVERYRELAALTRTGWWEFNTQTKIYLFSDLIPDILKSDSNIITSVDFENYVRKDYIPLLRELMHYASSPGIKLKEIILPLITQTGEVNVKLTIYNVKPIESGLNISGTLQVVQESINERSEHHTKLLAGINSVSMAMKSLLEGNDETFIINNLLSNLIDYYNADGIIINKFNEDKTNLSVFYNVISPHANNSIKKIYDIPTSAIPWITDQISAAWSVVINSLEEMPNNALKDKQILKEHNIYSLICIPIYNGTIINGFISIYTSKEDNKWSDDDYLLLLSASHISGICCTATCVKRAQEEERRLRTILLQHMPIGYEYLRVMRDNNHNIVDFKILDSNKLASKLLNIPNIFCGVVGSKIYPSRAHKEKLAYIQSTLYNGYTEHDIKVKRNLFRHVISVSPGDDEVINLFIDTTATINAFKAKYNSDKMFTDIFINIPVSEAIFDKEGRIINMNQNFMESFGITSLQDVDKYLLFDDPNFNKKDIDEIVSNNKYAFRTHYNFDSNTSFKTRRTGIVSMSCKTFRLFNEKNRDIGFMLISLPDDDKIISIKHKYDFEDFFNLISEYAKIGYAKYNIITGEGYAINQWYKNIGIEVKGQIKNFLNSYDNLSKEDREIFFSFLNKAKRGEQSQFNWEIQVVMPDGKLKWIFSNAVITRYMPEEGIIEIIAVNYDITHFKQTERREVDARLKAEEMDKLKSAFLANMSHEIRTPLNAIVGFSNLIVDTENIDERRQFSSIIKVNNDILLQLINDILDLSKLEAGMVEIKLSLEEVNSIMKDIILTTKFKVRENVKLLLEMPDEEFIITTDRRRISQVLINLITNAAKFTTIGSIIVGYNRVDNSHIRFYVKDTGIGISPDQQKVVFDRFVKLNDYSQGTGLGLSICSTIIEQMGGTIGVESTMGKGSTFWFILPIGTQTR